MSLLSDDQKRWLKQSSGIYIEKCVDCGYRWTDSYVWERHLKQSFEERIAGTICSECGGESFTEKLTPIPPGTIFVWEERCGAYGARTVTS